MRSVLAVAAALFLVPASRVCADEPLPPLLQGVARIVTLGDSITQAGAEPGGYVWLMDRYLKAIYPSTPIEIVNAGISGHKSTDMQARFERDVLAAKPQLVTISVGVNDVWHAFRDFQTQQDHPDGDLPNGVPLPVYTEKLEAMIAAATTAGIKVVLVTPTPIHENPSTAENQRLRSYLAAMSELARKHGWVVVDVNGVMTDVIVAYRRAAGPHRNVLTTDGVHMNAAGNQLMAWQILRAMGVPEMALATAQIEGTVTR
jgi:acyl-CoA thioesterase-1